MSFKRKPVRQKGKAARKFSREARTTKIVNVRANPMRGGFRL